MFFKDALFKEEVEKKVTISPEDIAKGITRSKYKNITYIIPFIDSSETFATYKSLVKGVMIDSVIKSHNIDTNNVFEIKYGMMDDEHIEDIVFKLKTGQYSPPIKYKGRWFIFYLKNRIFSTEKDDNKIEHDVKTNLHDRKAREIGLNYLGKS